MEQDEWAITFFVDLSSENRKEVGREETEELVAVRLEEDERARFKEASIKNNNVITF